MRSAVNTHTLVVKRTSYGLNKENGHRLGFLRMCGKKPKNYNYFIGVQYIGVIQQCLDVYMCQYTMHLVPGAYPRGRELRS